MAVKNNPTKENELVENGKKKGKEERPATKVVVRRLPPSMTEEQFKMQVSPLPEIDYFYFVTADMSLMPNAFCRAYINFVDQSDLFIFTQKFDGYVFLDSKGGEFPAVVEFAPFQRIPKNRPNRKKDPKVGTIESDPVFIAFKERLEAENLENKMTTNAAKQHFFETSLVPEKKENNNTPLLDFIKNKRAERQRIRDEKREEKRKKELERKRAKERTKKEDETSVVKVLNNQNSIKERTKEKEVKPSLVKKKSEDVKTTSKDKSESRTKESKTRAGKSYLEERQRQAERREEQRKKLSQSQSSSPVTESKPLTTSDDKTATEENTVEEKTVTESKPKDSDYKKSERGLKKEESRRNSSYKYEGKRERDGDDSRKPRRTNSERSHVSSRRDDERSEEGGRKRYSESRRSHDPTQRDRYKDKDKSKTYGQKKILVSATGADKNETSTENSFKSSSDVNKESLENVKSGTKGENGEFSAGDQANKTKPEEVESTSELGTKPKAFEGKDKTKPTRRKSLDYDKSRSSSTYKTYTSGKSYTREKYSERKRRNSLGSSKPSHESIEVGDDQDTTESKPKKNTITNSTSKENITTVIGSEPVNEIASKEESMDGFEQKDSDILKRRNSTGERPQKMSPRRNSLGSEDTNKICNFKETKFGSGAISEEDKHRDEKKFQRSNGDPRTERRIRNKDRPSREIYRPGMGKFSKQRLEREKGLGSSTEVDSPSPSPSPTPVLKFKTVPPLH